MSGIHALTSIKRAKQRTLTKIGLGVETQDSQFDQHATRWQERRQLTGKVSELARKSLAAGLDLVIAAAAVSNLLARATGVQEAETAAHISAHHAALLSSAKAGEQAQSAIRHAVIVPLCAYEGQFCLLEERLKLRQTRKIDMDRYIKALAGKSKKDRTTFERAQAKAEGAKTAFHTLNEELKRDMPNVSNKVQALMDHAVQSLLRDQGRFAAACVEALRPVQQRLTQANVRAGGACGLASAVTPIAQSAMQDADVKRRQLDDFGAAPSTAAQQGSSGTASARASVNAGSSASPRASTVASAAAPRPQPVPPAKKKAPAPPPPSAGPKVQALWDFAGTESDELPFKKGDILTLVNEDDPDWWMCANDAGSRGTIPSNYVKKM